MPKKPYRRATKPVQIPLHSVINVLTEIHKVGHSEQLQAQAKASDAHLTISPEAVNLVKDYLYQNSLHEDNTTLADMINSKGTVKCPYKEG